MSSSAKIVKDMKRQHPISTTKDNMVHKQMQRPDKRGVF